MGRWSSSGPTCWISRMLPILSPSGARRLPDGGDMRHMDNEETVMILQRATMLAGRGLKAKDALHIACAIAGECAYFITTDDDILKRRQDVHDITVIDPTAFVREMNL